MIRECEQHRVKKRQVGCVKIGVIHIRQQPLPCDERPGGHVLMLIVAEALHHSAPQYQREDDDEDEHENSGQRPATCASARLLPRDFGQSIQEGVPVGVSARGTWRSPETEAV